MIIRGFRNRLNWEANPIPRIHSTEARKRPSVLPNLPTEIRKPHKIRNIEHDQLSGFNKSDLINELKDIDGVKHCPAGFQFKRNENSIIFYRTVFDEKTDFPSICECIKIDADLHVKLQYNGNSLPLPKWLVHGRSAKLTRISMLQNLPSYIASIRDEHPSSILEELVKRQHYKPGGRPPYSPEIIRYALLLRYTSPRAYRLLREKLLQNIA